MDAGRLGRRQWIDLDEIELPEGESLDWLKEKVGQRPSYDTLDRLELSGQLPDYERSILASIVRSMRNDPIGTGAVLSGKGEIAPSAVRAYRLPTINIPRGETDRQKQLRMDMMGAEGCKPYEGWRPRSYLIGQEHLLDSCVRMLKDWESPARRTAPIAAFVGDEGHGELPLIQGYVRSVFDSRGEIVTVDLAGKNDRDHYDSLFGKGAPLSVDNLKRLAGTGALWITGADKLKDREDARGIYNRIVKLLEAKDGEPDYARTHWFFYFEGLEKGADPRRRMREAFGPAGTEGLSAAGKLEHLEGKHMIEYMRDLLPEIMQRRGLDALAFQYEHDKKALDTLGEALATPHAPLFRLENRLLRLVLDKFDTHTSVDRAGSFLTLTLAPEYARDENRLTAAVKALHEEDPDLFEGGKIFRVEEIGRSRIDEAARKAALAKLDEIIKGLAPLQDAIKGKTFGANGKALSQKIGDLRKELIAAKSWADKNEQLRLVEMLPKRRRDTIAEMVNAAQELLTSAVENLPPKPVIAQDAQPTAEEKKILDQHATTDGLANMLAETTALLTRLKGEVPAPVQVQFDVPLPPAWGKFDPPHVRIEYNEGDPAKNEQPAWVVQVRNQFREQKPLEVVARRTDGTEIARMKDVAPGAGKGWKIREDQNLGLVPGGSINLEVPGYGFTANLTLPPKGEVMDTGAKPELWNFDAAKADQIPKPPPVKTPNVERGNGGPVGQTTGGG